MDASRRVSDEALTRLKAVLFSHMNNIRRFDASHVIITGTSATRDAVDAHRIESLVFAQTGTDLTILSGEEEAQATFLGAVSGLKGNDPDWNKVDETENVTVIDVGGGSTEFVQGMAQSDTSTIRFKRSLDMGSVRMTERFFTRQPAANAEIENARSALVNMFEKELEGARKTRICIGASGTPIILSLVHHGLSDLASSSMTISEVTDWSRRLYSMNREEVLALHPARMKGREDVFPCGVMVLAEALEFLGAERLFVSPYGVRHGIAMRYFEESGL